jgi:hypothetical protein
LLYSTRSQDEERLTALLSKVTGENIGVKWKPIRANTFSSRKKEKQDPEETVRALHVECAVDRLQEVWDKLNIWYSSASTKFSDGTKMRLVPTITSVTSLSNKTKFASCVARQAALNAQPLREKSPPIFFVIENTPQLKNVQRGFNGDKPGEENWDDPLSHYRQAI